MRNQPTEKQLARIPRLYETESVGIKDKIIQMHFVFPKCDWYIAEFDGKDIFFGFVILNEDLEMAEWGYISYSELKEIDITGFQIEFDLGWSPKKASEIERICEAQGWDIPMLAPVLLLV